MKVYLKVFVFCIKGSNIFRRFLLISTLFANPPQISLPWLSYTIKKNYNDFLNAFLNSIYKIESIKKKTNDVKKTYSAQTLNYKAWNDLLVLFFYKCVKYISKIKFLSDSYSLFLLWIIFTAEWKVNQSSQLSESQS